MREWPQLLQLLVFLPLLELLLIVAQLLNFELKQNFESPLLPLELQLNFEVPLNLKLLVDLELPHIVEKLHNLGLLLTLKAPLNF